MTEEEKTRYSTIALYPETKELIHRLKHEGMHDSFDSVIRKLAFHWDTGINRQRKEMEEEKDE